MVLLVSSSVGSLIEPLSVGLLFFAGRPSVSASVSRQLKSCLVVSFASQVESQPILDVPETMCLHTQPFEFVALIFVEQIELFDNVFPYC
jgi:hypothetical protein